MFNGFLFLLINHSHKNTTGCVTLKNTSCDFLIFLNLKNTWQVLLLLIRTAEVQTCWRESNSYPCKYQILISVPLLLERIFNTCSSVINIFLSQQFTQSLKIGYWKTKVSHFVSKYVHEDNIPALRGKLNHQYENDWLIQECYMWKTGIEAHHSY